MENIHPTETPSFSSRTDLSQLNQSIERIKEEIRKVIVGQDEMIELLMIALLAEGHVLIEGVPGTAKTLTAKLLAKTISSHFGRIQFTPDLMPSDVIGTSVYNFKTSEFEFKKGPIFANIILIDEINRSPAKTQAALFEVMEEAQITMDGISYPMEKPFFVMATQNPIEHEGTYRLPEAQLDRFLFKITIQYPSQEQELQILTQHHHRKSTINFNLMEAVMDAKTLAENQLAAREIIVEDKLMSLIVQIIHKTRTIPELYLGASTRASVSMLNAAKACAAIRGRDFVTPDDILFVCKPILRHRIVLTPEKEMEGVGADEVIDLIIKSIEIPR